MVSPTRHSKRTWRLIDVMSLSVKISCLLCCCSKAGWRSKRQTKGLTEHDLNLVYFQRMSHNFKIIEILQSLGQSYSYAVFVKVALQESFDLVLDRLSCRKSFCAESHLKPHSAYGDKVLHLKGRIIFEA